jgi:hypothetical protein
LGAGEIPIPTHQRQRKSAELLKPGFVPSAVKIEMPLELLFGLQCRPEMVVAGSSEEKVERQVPRWLSLLRSPSIEYNIIVADRLRMRY